MNKKIKTLVTLILTAGLAFVFAACENSLSIKKNTEEKLIPIHPVVNLQNRSALPEYDYENISKDELTDFVFTYKSAKISEVTINYQNAELLENSEIHLAAGDYSFTLSAKYEGLVFKGYTDQTISLDADNVISFVLYPNGATASSGSGDYGTLKITLELPEETIASYNTGKITLDGSDVPITSNDYRFDEETGNFVFEKRLKVSNVWYEIVLSLIDENHNVFSYTTSALIEKEKNSVEVYEVEEFLKGYEITWHISETEEVKTYYATTYGYDLYLPYNYYWYTDSECSIAATSGEAGSVQGPKEFWATVNSNYGFVTIYDIDNPTVPLKKVTVNYNEYFYIDSNYKVKFNNRNYIPDESFELENKEGYYVSKVYRDVSKNEYSLNSSYYYYSGYKNIYIEYKPYKTLTLVSLNSNEVIGTHAIKDWYSLENYSINFDRLSKWDFVEKSLNYYSVPSVSDDSKLTKSTKYYPTEDVTIYVDDYLEPVFTLNYINKNTDEIFKSFTEKYYFNFDNSNLKTSVYTTYMSALYCHGGYVKDTEGNYIELTMKTNYYLDPVMNTVTPEVLAAIDEDNIINVYVDLIEVKTVTFDCTYNVPYKVAIVDEENNSRLVKYEDSIFVDKDNKFVWWIYSSSSTGRQNRTFSYIPIDKEKDFTFTNELIPVESQAAEVEHRNYSGKYDYYTLVDSEVPYVVYTYNLEKGRTYNMNYASTYTGSFAGSTYANWYLISPSNKQCLYSYYSGFNYTAEEDGEYKLVFGPYDFYKQNTIKVKYQLYSLYNSQTNIAVTLVNSDINTSAQQILDSQDDATITLTAPDGYYTYEWLMDDYPLGFERNLTIYKDDFVGLSDGTETYYVTLKVRENRSDSYFYTATLKLKAEPVSEEE